MAKANQDDLKTERRNGIYKLILSLLEPDLFEGNFEPLDPTLFVLTGLTDFPFLINGR